MKLKAPYVVELLTAWTDSRIGAKVRFDTDDDDENLVVRVALPTSNADESLESVKSRAIARARELLSAEQVDSHRGGDQIDAGYFEPNDE